MNNTIRITVLSAVTLAAVSLLALNFSGAGTTPSTAPARHYYLTKAKVNGNKTLTACAAGYHFASFAELVDPGFLTYNKTLGRSEADDGAGPPSVGIGWVRSGFVSNSSSSSTYSPTNCNLWTSAATGDSGEVGLFDPNVAGSGVPAPVFEFANGTACDNSGGFDVGVWCVEN
jgi:hypothetical protein